MFNLFKKSQPATVANVVEPITSSEPSQPVEADLYRVGYHNTDRHVTLTLRGDKYSSTLGMTPQECERMIRMLRAAYPIGWEEHEEEFDDSYEHGPQ
jgi:hypothetical protein